MEQLKRGSFLKSDVGLLEVKSFIAQGGQGEVYVVSLGGKDYALKWYHPHIITNNLKQSIQKLVDEKSPNDNFLWPLFTVSEGTGFGYVMDLRPKEYKSLQDWIRRKFDMSIQNIIKISYELSDSFNELHAKGLSYQDISFGNIFIEPIKGKILIVDNDNVTTNNKTIESVSGTDFFKAPELVSGRSNRPNADTDRFSLAVLLFYIWTIGHPFNGDLEQKVRCLDLPAQRMLYGDNAVFIFHPTNQSNRPVRGVHNGTIALWGILPDFIKELFTKTFVEGIKDVNCRAREIEWKRAFLQFSGIVYTCPNCGKTELIYNNEKMKLNGKSDKCTKCNTLPNVPRIKISDHIVVCNNGRQLFKFHLQKGTITDTTPVARFNYMNNQLTITNLIDTNININTTAASISKGNSHVIQNGDQITINGITGLVRF